MTGRRHVHELVAKNKKITEHGVPEIFDLQPLRMQPREKLAIFVNELYQTLPLIPRSKVLEDLLDLLSWFMLISCLSAFRIPYSSNGGEKNIYPRGPVHG
jgi:hypothetical protein